MKKISISIVAIVIVAILAITVGYKIYQNNVEVAQIESVSETISNNHEIIMNDDEIAVKLIPNLDKSGFDSKSDDFTIVLLDENISRQIKAMPIVEDAFVLYESSGGGQGNNTFKYIDSKATAFLPKTEEQINFDYPKKNEVVISSKAASMYNYQIGDAIEVNLVRIKSVLTGDEMAEDKIEEVKKTYKISSIINFDVERYYLSIETEQEIKMLLNEERYYNFDASIFIIKRDAMDEFKSGIHQYLPDYYEVIEYVSEN